MEFVDSILLQIGLRDQKKMVPCYVGTGLDNTIIMGTNALKLFGFSLTVNGEMCQGHSGETKDAFSDVVNRAVVKERAYIPPYSTGSVRLSCTCIQSEAVLWSSTPFISDGLCHEDRNGAVEVPVVNRTSDPVVFRVGECVGDWGREQWISPAHVEASADMLDLSTNSPPAVGTERIKALLCAIPHGNELNEEMKELLGRYTDVFALTDTELTQTNLVVHEIDTGDSKPVKQKTRPVPIAARQEFKGIIKGLLERGIIEKSNSEWASPVVLVRKKDGTLRLCIDYRELNKVTRQDSYPLPTIDALLQSLSGKKTFSTLDMHSGYWQIKLSENAKRKSAFTTSEGLFQFAVLPFGLCTSPTVFQRMMDMILGDPNIKDDEVFVYVDDILVATESETRLYEVLDMIFNAMKKATLRLKPKNVNFSKSKCRFWVTS
ncbi:unnamed protein product [Heligmosomoides polygyrus]|uniref:Reverse transcriptase domain-containing protein n=1 Tax=Heligmosomoides polygyrus TaxID=6339 RepID=A0A183G4A7_HELPZ|nr:unnamed protein product [Heligmosomoides polygyrus]